MPGVTNYTTSLQVSQQNALASDIAKLQSQISTGKKLTAASDDPAAAAQIAQIRQTQANNIVYSSNADTGTAIASAADTTLTSVFNALNRANEILINGNSGTSSAADRQNLATELRGIAQDISGYANATDPSGNPLFPATPNAIPVSDSMSVTATPSQAQVFTITNSDGTPISLSDYLSAAADRLANATTGATTTSTDITTLGNAIDQIDNVRTQQGIREQRFSDAKDSLADAATDLTTQRANLEGTDLTTAVSSEQADQLSLQAAQTMYAQTHKSTLFDLIA
jgi:flagellar hook-associated protein 3 FlgL